MSFLVRQYPVPVQDQPRGPPSLGIGLSCPFDLYFGAFIENAPQTKRRFHVEPYATADRPSRFRPA